MSDSVLDRVRHRLAEVGAVFGELHHPPTHTSEESAAARGEPLGVGAKALLVKTGDVFRLFVLPADRKLDSSAVKRELKVKQIRFATPDELRELTDLVPGAVPPFGPPVLPFELFADPDVGAEYGRVAFNAGSLTVSVVMTAADWKAAARPRQFALARPSEQD